MFIIEFERDTELMIDEPPYDAYFESGDTFECDSYRKDMDMVHVNHPIYGKLIIFNESITITEKSKEKA